VAAGSPPASASPYCERRREVAPPAPGGEVAAVPAPAPAPPREPAPTARPGDGVVCTDYQEVRDPTLDPSWTPTVVDVAQHLPERYLGAWYPENLKTAVHESSHFISSQLANLYGPFETRYGFYLLNDCAAMVDTPPGVTITQAAAYVPEALRGLRYQHYMIQQAKGDPGYQGWDAISIYIFDEWIAYINGGTAMLEMVRAGQWKHGHSDGVAGALEFTIYALAVGLAVRDQAPEYFAANQQFREVLAHEALRALTLFRAAKDLPEFPSEEQHRLYAELRTGPAGDQLRAFCVDSFGEAFTAELLDLGELAVAP
jgi:hypothetical protein